MKLTEEMLEALAAANPDGNLLYLQGTLGRQLYEQVDAALNTVGGRWSKSKKAHVFPGPAYPAVLELCSRDEVETAPERKQATQFFETPPDVVAELLDAAHLSKSHVVLEPSAGRGAIASAVAPLVAAVDCIELDSEYAADIIAAGYAREVRFGDFLSVPPEPVYDRVIMNPPFTRCADVTHVQHALRFVKPGGRLVAVMAAGVKSRSDTGTRAFRSQVEQAHGWYADVDADAFKASGTGVRTVIVTIPVPAVAVTAGEPARVTTDHDAEGLPLFDPAATAPGVYVHWDSWAGRDRVFRFRGHCIGCGTGTWAHDEGGDDVRGLFGDYTYMPIDDEDLAGEVDEVPEGTSFPRCATCWNDARRYRKALDNAVAQLRRGAGPATRALAASRPSAPTQLDLFSGEDAA